MNDQPLELSMVMNDQPLDMDEDIIEWITMNELCDLFNDSSDENIEENKLVSVFSNRIKKKSREQNGVDNQDPDGKDTKPHEPEDGTHRISKLQEQNDANTQDPNGKYMKPHEPENGNAPKDIKMSALEEASVASITQTKNDAPRDVTLSALQEAIKSDADNQDPDGKDWKPHEPEDGTHRPIALDADNQDLDGKDAMPHEPEDGTHRAIALDIQTFTTEQEESNEIVMSARTPLATTQPLTAPSNELSSAPLNNSQTETVDVSTIKFDPGGDQELLVNHCEIHNDLNDKKHDAQQLWSIFGAEKENLAEEATNRFVKLNAVDAKEKDSDYDVTEDANSKHNLLDPVRLDERHLMSQVIYSNQEESQGITDEDEDLFDRSSLQTHDEEKEEERHPNYLSRKEFDTSEIENDLCLPFKMKMDGKVVPLKSYMVFQFNDPMKSTEISINGSDIKRVRSSRVCQCIFCIRRIIATYKEKEFSILPNGEDENCVFDALALRGTGPPGLYLYDKKNNTITAIQTVKDVAKYKENKISTIKSWAKATDTATNTTAEAIDVDINMMRTTIEPINGTKTIEDAHKQEQLSLNGAANAMNTVTSDNKESKDAKAHRNDLDAIDAMNTVTSNDNQVQNIFKKAFVKKKKIKRRILRSADESVNNNAQLSEAIDQIKVSDRFDVVTTHALGSKDKLEEDSINNAKNGDDENTQFHTENDIKWTKNAQISETIDETNGNVVIVSPTHDESPSLVSPYDETNEIEFETDRDTHNLANKSLTQHGHAALSASLLSHNPTRAIVRILKPVSNQQAECIESNDETNNAKVNDTEIESSVSNQQSDTQIEIESKAMNTIQMEEDSKSNDKASNCGMSSEATQQLNEMASIDLERLHCNNYVYNANVAAFKKPNDDMNLELDANSIDDTLTEWAFNTILIEFEQLYDDDHEDEPQLDAHNEDEPNVMHTMDMEEDEESSDESSSCLLDVELNAMHTMETKEDEDSSDESSSCELPPERECLLKQQTNEILRLQRINYVETSKRKHRHNKRKQLKELNKETVRHRLASISEIDTNQKDGEQTANIASEVADIAFDIDAVEEDKKKKRYAPILQDDEIDGREAKGLGSRVRSIQEHDQQQTKQQQKAIKNQQLKRFIQMDHDRHMKDKQDKLSPVPPNDIDSNTTAKTVIVRRRARLSNACPTEEPMLQRRARPSTRYPNPCVPLYIPNGDTNGIKHRKSRKFKMSQIFGGRFSRKGGDDDAVPKRVMYGLEDDKYELYPWLKPTRKLGCGAYATVCEVRDSRTKRKYAIKKNRDVFNNVADARRILREIKLMIWMNHENVMGLVGCIPPETWEMNTFNEVYLIMTRCDTTLKRVIRSRQSLSDAHIQFFVYQIARGLEYMHSGNIIHRDLKPENILVDVGNCRIRITDIGLARGVLDDGDGPQKLTEYVVTRWYRAPEVMCCKKMYDPRIDVWSLGCVMAELYARRPLWKGQNSHGQLKEIFGTLGTPTNTDWVTTPSEKRWIERQPPQKGSGLMLKGATPLATQFISHLLVMNPHQRPSISQVIEHPFLASRKKDKHYKTCAKFNISFEFEKKIKTLFGVRHMMYQELLSFHKKVCKQNRIDMAPNKELYPSFGFDKYEVLCTGYVNQVSDMFDYKMTVPCAVAKLICLFTHLCLQLEEDNPYYQVQNGSINTLSTNGHEHNLYNVKDLECNGRYDWRFKVTKQQQTKPQCVVSKNTIEVTHNDTPTKGTGYSPNMVRAAFMTPSLLDIRMGIAGITQLEQKDYIESGMVDFKKLIDTAMKINKTIVTQIKLNKINQNREQEMKNHIKALQKIKPSISIGDHVIYRGPPTVGKHGNDRIGYIVTDVISPKHPKDKNKKKHYMIKNVRTGAKFATNKGHLTRFARPRLLRALSSNNPMTRMMDLKHWRGNNLSELIEKESSK
eukprot:23580_1